MKIISRYYIVAFAICLCHTFLLKANSDSVKIKVHFLHGSRPKHAYKHHEKRWFGGVLGGHAGVEYETNKIINFVPAGGFHIFSHHNSIKSCFTVHDTISFYEILGGNYDSVKRTTIVISISQQQKQKLDSLAKAYKHKSPYDYAFFGMRCGAAACDVLARTGVITGIPFRATWRRIFYPRKLRRRLESIAVEKRYVVKKTTGSTKRKWEKD